MNNWSECKKIMCVRLDNIGDLLMTTPAIRALKETDPSREIIVLTSEAGADVAPLVPEINGSLVYNAPWVKASCAKASEKEDLAIIPLIKEHNFDGAIIFNVFSQNPLPAAMMSYLAGIPLRLAYCHENPYQLLTDWIKDPEPQTYVRHEVQRQLDLVAAIGSTTLNPRLSLSVPVPAEIQMVAQLKEKGISFYEPLIIIHPGATAPSRRYPAEKFQKVASHLVKKLGCQVIFTGGADERELIESLQAKLDFYTQSFVGCLTFAEFSALISLGDVLITNNTGPAHVASAVGTPVVDLYALTNPQHTPWHVPSRVLFHDVPCKYCYKSICPQGHHHCLELVGWEDVAKAAEELLEEALIAEGG
jgi:lipopolysaccharide heptosyltransferase II